MALTASPTGLDRLDAHLRALTDARAAARASGDEAAELRLTHELDKWLQVRHDTAAGRPGIA